MHVAVLLAEGTQLVLLAEDLTISLAQLALLRAQQPLELVEPCRGARSRARHELAR